MERSPGSGLEPVMPQSAPWPICDTHLVQAPPMITFLTLTPTVTLVVVVYLLWETKMGDEVNSRLYFPGGGKC